MKKLIFSIALLYGITANAQQLLQVLEAFPENNDGGGDDDGGGHYISLRNDWKCLAGLDKKVTVTLRGGIISGGEVKYEQFSNQTILDGAMEQQLDIPYSDTHGFGSSAAALVIFGNVNNEGNNFLNIDQLNRGYILLDVAYPCEDVIIEIDKEHEVSN